MQLELFSESELPTSYGSFLVSVYRDRASGEESILISKDLKPDQSIFVRIHSECFTGEVLGSLKCDCKDQLSLALEQIQEQGSGAIIYLRQEGRGIGLGNKIKAYHLQNQGVDTVEANHLLGFATDLRSFEAAALILKDRGISKVILNTNNPEKIESLKQAGIEVVERVPSLASINDHNSSYLRTKMKLLGHKLEDLFDKDKD